MRDEAGFRRGMGPATRKTMLSLGVAAGAGVCLLILLETLLLPAGAVNAGARLLRIQMSSMIAMAVFAGLAIVIYTRRSRSSLSGLRKK